MSSTIFQGSAVKLLKNTLRFFDGTDFTSVNLLTTSNSKVLTNKTLTNALLTTNGTLDVTAAGTLSIAASLGANNLTLAGATSTVVIPGNLQVNGSLAYVNTTNLDVVDANITVNKGGNQATADTQDAGFTVEMTDATDTAIGYNSTLASRFMCGDVGSLVEIATVSHTQAFTNKTFNVDATGNVLSNVANGNIKAAAAIDVNKLAALTASRAIVSDASGFLSASTATAAEVGYLSGASSNIQTQLNTIGGVSIYDFANSSGTFTAVAGKTHLVDTSSASSAVTLPAVAANIYVRIKDNGNSNTNNITVTPASGTIDGAANDVINSDFAAVIYACDGTNWYKI